MAWTDESATANTAPGKTLIDMQLDAYAAQVRYETLAEAKQDEIKAKDEELKRNFWLNIALIIALGYAAGK
jgi:hypothetical protein